MKDKYSKMLSGKDGWHEDMKDFSNLPTPSKDDNGDYEFKDVKYKNYVKDI